MKHLATFPNAAEAGFVQSLLASEGIAADIQDGILDIAGVPGAWLHVADEDFASAAEIVAAHRMASAMFAAEKSRDEHPAATFPFFGVMGFIGLAWALFWVGMALFQTPRGTLLKDGPLHAGMMLIAIGSMALLWGLMIGFGVAVFCLIVRTTWRKLTHT